MLDITDTYGSWVDFIGIAVYSTYLELREYLSENMKKGWLPCEDGKSCLEAQNRRVNNICGPNR